MMFKPWLGFQWMCDQQETTALNNAVKAKINKAHLLFRLDGLDISSTGMVAAYNAGTLDTVYNKFVSAGLKEIWCAAYWNDGAEPGDTDADTANWFLNHSESNGGIIRVINHYTDVVDDTFSNGDACTSDGTSFDQFTAAGIRYETDCDLLTAYGFTIGSDGYGKGYPNVQNSNNMNNPSAAFLADGWSEYDDTTGKNYGRYGCHLWLSSDDSYPTSGETPATTKTYSHNWNGGQTLTVASGDGINTESGQDANVALAWNQLILRQLIYGGGIYYHGTQLTSRFLPVVDEYTQLFTTCPDVLSSGTWEQMLVELKRGSGILFDI
jgi:hypothetical protein